MPAYRLVQVFTADNLKLTGLYLPGDDAKSACIFIHGFTGDFYTHNFYHALAEKLQSHGNAIILAQTRGSGVETEFLTSNGKGEFFGSFFEKIEDAHLDITAFVDFLLKEGYQKIILIGHSLGTIKSIRYLFEGEHKNKINKLVLLAPFDKNVFMEIKAPGRLAEFLQVAEQKITSGHGRDIVPLPEYEDYAMSYATFVSWYTPYDLNQIWDFYRKDYNFPVLQQIDIPVKVILGSKDEGSTYPQFGETPEKVLAILKSHIKKCDTTLIENAGHTYFGFENQMADAVSSFV